MGQRIIFENIIAFSLQKSKFQTIFRTPKMPNRKSLTEAEKASILTLKGLKMSIRQISEQIKCSKSKIGRFLANPAKYCVARRLGRPKSLSSRKRFNILRLASNKSISCQAINYDLKLESSRWTVNRVINNSGILVHQKKIVSPALTESHKAARLSWARKYMTWNLEWRKVFWSDEKKFNLDGPDGFAYYWHDLRKSKITFSRRIQGGGGVMIWAAFNWNQKLEICFIDSKLNARGYQRILERYLLPAFTPNENDGMFFQQDNAPIHKASSTLTWLREKNIATLDWPALSPDLNPIENLWGLLARRVYEGGRQFSSVNELKDAILCAWSGISKNDIESLVGSLPNRVFEVISQGGNKINY